MKEKKTGRRLLANGRGGPKRPPKFLVQMGMLACTGAILGLCLAGPAAAGPSGLSTNGPLSLFVKATNSTVSTSRFYCDMRYDPNHEACAYGDTLVYEYAPGVISFNLANNEADKTLSRTMSGAFTTLTTNTPSNGLQRASVIRETAGNGLSEGLFYVLRITANPGGGYAGDPTCGYLGGGSYKYLVSHDDAQCALDRKKLAEQFPALSPPYFDWSSELDPTNKTTRKINVCVGGQGVTPGSPSPNEGATWECLPLYGLNSEEASILPFVDVKEMQEGLEDFYDTPYMCKRLGYYVYSATPC